MLTGGMKGRPGCMEIRRRTARSQRARALLGGGPVRDLDMLMHGRRVRWWMLACKLVGVG